MIRGLPGIAGSLNSNGLVVAGAVPEPTSLAALACGVAGTVGAAAYRRKKAGQPVA